MWEYTVQAFLQSASLFPQRHSIPGALLPARDPSAEVADPIPLAQIAKAIGRLVRVGIQVEQLALILRAQIELPPVGKNNRPPSRQSSWYRA